MDGRGNCGRREKKKIGRRAARSVHAPDDFIEPSVSTLVVKQDNHRALPWGWMDIER